VATFTVRNLTGESLLLEEGRVLSSFEISTFEKKLREAGDLAQNLNELRAAGKVEISVELENLSLEGL
jgi:hypothetical protein